MIASAAGRRVQEHRDGQAGGGGRRGQPLNVVKAKTVDLLIPAEAEIVIEGFINTECLEPEAPFGEYHGYMCLPEYNGFMDITCITRRKDAIYHDYGSGLRDMLVPDNMVMEGKIFAMAKAVAPSLRRVHVPVSGRRFHAYLQFETPGAGEARDSLTAVLGYRRQHVGHDPFAVGTIIIEELDDGHVAVRIAAHRRRRIVKQFLALAGQGGAHLVRFGGLLARIQDIEHLKHHVGLGDEVLVDGLLDYFLGRGRRLVRGVGGRRAGPGAAAQRGGPAWMAGVTPPKPGANSSVTTGDRHGRPVHA